MTASRFTLSGLAALTAGAALFGGAAPAHAANVPSNFPNAQASFICYADFDKGESLPGWSWELDLASESDAPVWFLVDIDNLAAQNIQLQPGEQSIDHRVVSDGVPSKIQIFAGGVLIYSQTDEKTCDEPHQPSSAAVTFSCGNVDDPGAQLLYELSDNEPNLTNFDLILPDGTTEVWNVAQGIANKVVPVDEDTEYVGGISLNGVELAKTEGQADCDPPAPPVTIPDRPDTVPTTEPTPPPTVLSSGETAAAPDAEAPDAEATQLPRTGTATLPMAGAGFTSLLIGSGFLALARRRRLQA